MELFTRFSDSIILSGYLICKSPGDGTYKLYEDTSPYKKEKTDKHYQTFLQMCQDFHNQKPPLYKKDLGYCPTHNWLFNDRTDLERHTKLFHDGKADSCISGAYICSFILGSGLPCGAQFNNQAELASHKRKLDHVKHQTEEQKLKRAEKSENKKQPKKKPRHTPQPTKSTETSTKQVKENYKTKLLPSIEPGAKVRVWFQDKNKYYFGTVEDRTEFFTIKWRNGRRELIELSEKHRTSDPKDTDRWDYCDF
jgi:hypothetical protein